jgi:hypothetical protein
MSSTAADLNALLERLSDELEEASLHLKTQIEWKDADRYLEGLRPRVQTLAPDLEAVDDTVRELGAQLDMLALGRERSTAEEKRFAREKEERRREDQFVVSELVVALKWYGWLVAASFVLTPFAGVYMGQGVVFAGLPAAMGYARMVKARAPTTGRHWVILRGDVDVILDRAGFYDKAAGVAVATPLIWLILSNVITG